jgi:hypothetical protein
LPLSSEVLCALPHLPLSLRPEPVASVTSHHGSGVVMRTSVCGLPLWVRCRENSEVRAVVSASLQLRSSFGAGPGTRGICGEAKEMKIWLVQQELLTLLPSYRNLLFWEPASSLTAQWMIHPVLNLPGEGSSFLLHLFS